MTASEAREISLATIAFKYQKEIDAINEQVLIAAQKGNLEIIYEKDIKYELRVYLIYEGYSIVRDLSTIEYKYIISWN